MLPDASERRLHQAQMKAARAARTAAEEQQRPFHLLRPRIFPEGNMWCALYGENLQAGVAGFGETPEDAAADFDRNWRGQRLYGEAETSAEVVPMRQR